MKVSPPSVRVHLPLKQGLRHMAYASYTKKEKVRVHLPLKQGLRQEKR